ncbi:bifunctional histidinol-phosphatase/imidazoleglycerol-phosphate dehydratase HisB [Marinoscillum sp. MHG1-6]|uniref:bifunctional histidinol-phosphatase/imidazoleglycerol-phosphate dehydratase HisB n=1 Tax=Marinoscillum sp. MHG1-6 TaxID=2959627 RepID=UPI002157FBD8|nr:bifunctional histidinol-phosphatase/imidazoleglycerol-phosphate dehydratase HisB [Marinoscillum sp. MHG1-6]
MRPILFIDRDGTINHETEDEQIDNIDKVSYLTDVFFYLKKIQAESDYLLVMVTNQDGLGTDAFPEDTFWPVHNLIMRTLESQGIHFDAVHIDEHFPADNHPNRKPGIGMLTEYLKGDYDIKNSYVIGDRVTDIQLAENLGCRGIHISSKKTSSAEFTTESWREIYEHLVFKPRIASVTRTTKETDINISLNLDGSGKTKIDTGLGFFDHMLDQLGKHGGIDLEVRVNGDLHIDEHHTIEDTALALGEAFKVALGNKKGINRYGFLLPMDDVLAQVAIDFGGRPWMVWEAEFKREKIGEMPTEMFFHFFKSFSDTSLSNLNIKVEGDNEHHKIEGIFKAWAKAIKMAIKRNPDEMSSLPSTKGAL